MRGVFGGRREGEGHLAGKWRSPQVQKGEERRRAGFRIDLPVGIGTFH